MKRKPSFIISIYIDTNCINARQNIKPLSELERLYVSEKIIIEKTDTLDTELQEEKSYPKGLKKSLNYVESYGPAVVDHSRVGFSIVGSKDDDMRFSKVLSILWEQKARSKYSQQEIRDAMHISTAIRYGGNYFITQEKAILVKAKEIEKEFRIKIRNPIDCLTVVKKYLKKYNDNSR